MKIIRFILLSLFLLIFLSGSTENPYANLPIVPNLESFPSWASAKCFDNTYVSNITECINRGGTFISITSYP